MNEKLSPAADDLPDWAWVIVDKHDLGIRADCPLAGATVLLTDAADTLKEAAQSAFREQALTPETLRQMTACAEMIADAMKLASLCPKEPQAGTVTEADDGTLTWCADNPSGPC